MRRVTVTKATPVPVSKVRAHLTPAVIVICECGYEPTEVTTLDERIVVTDVPPGRLSEPRYIFEADGDNYQYRRADEGRMVEDVETTVEVASRNGTTEIRFRLTVTPCIPVPLLSRILAWRRGRALSRVFNRLTDALR